MERRSFFKRKRIFVVWMFVLSLFTSFSFSNIVYGKPNSFVQWEVEKEEEKKETNQKEASTQEVLQLDAPSYLLMEETTGQIICEKNSDERRSPASITKVMTLILIFDALESGKIQLTDEVTTSAHAKSMGGSQVFLEEGEVQTVETLIKCIVVASGNDASVAMAEYIAGSEEAFVKMMNERAEGLSMKETHFVDCCGLTEDEQHYSSAKDVAIMSRELSLKYPKIHEYASIWQEDITHVTKQGSKPFTLSNTNKLIRHYQGATGLKTGSTSKAKFCLTATAERNGIKLISVVMGAPDSKARVRDSSKLLDYGFANCVVYEDTEGIKNLPKVLVAQGMKKEVALKATEPFRYVFVNGKKGEITTELEVKKKIKAPVKMGQELGVLHYKVDGKEIGSVLLTAKEDIEKMSYKISFLRIIEQYISL